MTKFRPCIDLHQGQVKQIVGATLRDVSPDTAGPVENFVASQPAEWFATRYAQDGLTGGHLIQLGPGNQAAARRALAAYPGGLQVGGGVTLDNASQWLEAGAAQVILTSWLFDDRGQFRDDRLDALVERVGAAHLVLDLSCKRVGSGWQVAMNRWQTLTDLPVSWDTLDRLANRCGEFLIHAADVEGLCQGIDLELVDLLGQWGGLPLTYAGGVADWADVERIAERGRGRVDFTVGSALDLFGGRGVRYQDLLEFNRRQADRDQTAVELD